MTKFIVIAFRVNVANTWINVTVYFNRWYGFIRILKIGLSASYQNLNFTYVYHRPVLVVVSVSVFFF